MNTAEVIQIPTPLNQSDNVLGALADDIRKEITRTAQNRQEWIDITLHLAALVLKARERFSSNNDFGRWVSDQSFGITQNDRTGLLGMARDLELTRKVLAETDRTSWLHIWLDLIQPRCRQPTITPGALKKSVKRFDSRNGFFGRTRAQEVSDLFRHTITHRTICGAVTGKRGGPEIWQMILAAIDAGFARSTDAAITLPTLRLLFPNAAAPRGSRHTSYLNRYDLTNQRHREYVRDVIWPVALANKEAVIADPGCLQNLVAHASHETRAAVVEQKAVAKVATMPKHEDEIVMFGKHFWPRPEHANYSYDQLRAACWYFHDANHAYSLAPAYADPESRAIGIRFSTRWLGQYADREITDTDSRHKIKAVYNLVDELASAMIAKPDAECKMPTTPKTEGVW